jgi:hypothetical protein
MFTSDHANDKGNNNGKDRKKLARSLKLLLHRSCGMELWKENQHLQM